MVFGDKFKRRKIFFKDKQRFKIIWEVQGSEGSWRQSWSCSLCSVADANIEPIIDAAKADKEAAVSDVPKGIPCMSTGHVTSASGTQALSHIAPVW